jgi:hypothetical protein
VEVFISHSFEDGDRFDDLCHALEKEKIEYWRPKKMRGGESLRDQLRNAIGRCELCIFLATSKSVQSSWCSAELGAFWGAQKKVVIYVADNSLSDDDIPKQFKGDIWHRKIRDVVQEAKQTLADAKEKRQIQGQKDEAPTRVGDISVGALLELLRTTLAGKALSLLFLKQWNDLRPWCPQRQSREELKRARILPRF